MPYRQTHCNIHFVRTQNANISVWFPFTKPRYSLFGVIEPVQITIHAYINMK